MLQKSMVGPCGNAFLRDLKVADRLIFFWTVNEEVWMKASIRKKVDGVITDDPKKFLEVCKNYDGDRVRLPLKSIASVIWITMFAAVFSLLFRFRYRYGFEVKAGNARRRPAPIPLE